MTVVGDCSLALALENLRGRCVQNSLCDRFSWKVLVNHLGLTKSRFGR